jgi:ribosomal protein S27E
MMDHPIKPHKDGDNVISLAGVRIARGFSTEKYSEKCHHHNIVFDSSDRRIWCEDCTRTLDAFDAFLIFTRYFEDMDCEARSKLHTAQEAMKSTARLRATKALDKIWSGNVMAVSCPHCKKGLLPEDFSEGARSSWSRDLEIAERRKAKIRNCTL